MFDISWPRVVVENPKYLQETPGYSPPRPEIMQWLLDNMYKCYEMDIYSAGCNIIFDTPELADKYRETWFNKVVEPVSN